MEEEWPEEPGCAFDSWNLEIELNYPHAEPTMDSLRRWCNGFLLRQATEILLREHERMNGSAGLAEGDPKFGSLSHIDLALADQIAPAEAEIRTTHPNLGDAQAVIIKPYP